MKKVKLMTLKKLDKAVCKNVITHLERMKIIENNYDYYNDGLKLEFANRNLKTGRQLDIAVKKGLMTTEEEMSILFDNKNSDFYSDEFYLNQVKSKLAQAKRLETKKLKEKIDLEEYNRTYQEIIDADKEMKRNKN